MPLVASTRRRITMKKQQQMPDANWSRKQFLQRAGIASAGAILGGASTRADAAVSENAPRLAQAARENAALPNDFTAKYQVDVRDLGARGDGKTDDTTAFERAIAQSRAENKTVFVPRGTYRLTRTIHLREQLLLGQFAGGWPADSMPMPTLLIDHVKGAGIVMEAAASLHGVALLYATDTQFPKEGAHPAISLAGQGPTISSVRIQYAHSGIVTAPNAQPGRARFSDIFMVSPRHEGLYLTKSYDTNQLHNIQIWCNGAMATGPGFRLGRNDECQMSNCFSFNCTTAFLFETDEAKEGGGGFHGSLSVCATDFCGNGYVVRGAHNVDLSNSNALNHFAGLVIDGEKASVRVSNCLFQTNGEPTVKVANCGNLAISNSAFTRAGAQVLPYVNVEKCGSFSLTNCQFKAFSAGVVLGAGVQRAVVANNIFEGAFKAITDKTRANAKKILAPNISD